MQGNRQHEEKLKQKLMSFVADEFKSLVEEAINFAALVHEGQRRLSEESTLVHLLKVAIYTAELNLDVDSILAAVLHQTLRDYDRTKYSQYQEITAEIKRHFGDDVLNMLVTLENISQITKRDSESAAITKYVLKDAQDLRILFIRLCDKYHNAQTVKFLPPEKQEKLARKLIDIYGPIAEYLNLNNFKKEYEAVAMRILYPEEHKKL